MKAKTNSWGNPTKLAAAGAMTALCIAACVGVGAFSGTAAVAEGTEGTPEAAAGQADGLEGARAAYAEATPEASGTCAECHLDIEKLEASCPEGLNAADYLVSESYATSTHGQLGCTFCHGGNAEAQDAAEAMEGMLADPSADAGVTVCGQCHSDVTDVYKTSLHYTTAGLSAKYLVRCSVAQQALGTRLYADNWQQDSCMDCHQSCAMCHVTEAKDNEPGHDFMLSDNNEDAQQSCLAYCHSGGLGTCFPNTDLHGPSGLDMSCMDCHNVTEIHGDGVYRATMIHSGIVTTECEDCHDPEQLTGEWHSATHLEKDTCWACHSGPYRTCANCHSWTNLEEGDSPLGGATESFGVTLGMDEIAGKITTLAIAPVGPEMFQDGGIEYVAMDLLNTTSAIYPAQFHSTIVPELNQEFCDTCHGEGTYLVTEDQLLFPDYESCFLVDPLPEVVIDDYLDE